MFFTNRPRSRATWISTKPSRSRQLLHLQAEIFGDPTISTISYARVRGVELAKRTETTDLRGRVALLTGGRVKIGYQAGIKLLRAGPELIVTTRFRVIRPSVTRAEPDFGDWENRLEIFRLDLRHTPSVEAFCKHWLERATVWTSSSTTLVRRAASAAFLSAHDGT